MSVYESRIYKWLAELAYYAKVKKPVDADLEKELLYKRKRRRLEQRRAASKRWHIKNRERQLEYYRQWHKKRKLCKKRG